MAIHVQQVQPDVPVILLIFSFKKIVVLVTYWSTKMSDFIPKTSSSNLTTLSEIAPRSSKLQKVDSSATETCQRKRAVPVGPLPWKQRCSAMFQGTAQGCRSAHCIQDPNSAEHSRAAATRWHNALGNSLRHAPRHQTIVHEYKREWSHEFSSCGVREPRALSPVD